MMAPKRLFIHGLGLLVALFLAGAAHAVGDADDDGVTDVFDNCTEVGNPDQADADGDLFGDVCDCDYDQDLSCGFSDFQTFMGCFGQGVPGTGDGEDPTCSESDHDGNLFVNFDDFQLFLDGFGDPPGPSCCAETDPFGLYIEGAVMRQLTQSPNGAEDPSIIYTNNGQTNGGQTPDGNILIAWMEMDQSNSAGLWYKKVDADGELGGPVHITEGVSGNHWYPSIIQLADGTFAVAWFSGMSGNADIWFSRSTDGLTWGEPQPIAHDTDFDWAPSLTQAGDGTLWLAWASNRSGDKDVWVTTSTDGLSWSQPRRLEINTSDDEDFPTLAAGKNGGFALCWTRYPPVDPFDFDNIYGNKNSEIYISTSDDGVAWTPPRRLTNNNRVDFLPVIHQGLNFDWWIAWTTETSLFEGNIVYAQLPEQGPLDVYQITRGGAYSPKGLIASDGRHWLAWVSGKSGGLEVWYTHFNAGDLLRPFPN